VQDKKRKGKHIDERMMKKLLENPASVNWTAEDWAKELQCSKSTIHAARTWETILIARKLREAENVTTQKHYIPSDKRRFGQNRREPS
jgi:hypothetical protein